MILNLLEKVLKETGSTPNKFTIGMGKLVRKARHEAGLSQTELAKQIYVRQASISEIENGKREVSSSELVYLSFALNKPILYFFPNEYIKGRSSDELKPLIQELIIQANRLSHEDLKKVITQTKALADYD
jgi:transcriptional regulator with XRE-family HTH domain